MKNKQPFITAVENGGDINARDANGKTPLDYVQKAKKKLLQTSSQNIQIRHKKY